VKLRHLLLMGSILVWPLLALAGTDDTAPPALPEPEMLALLAIGGVALAIARWRSKK